MQVKRRWQMSHGHCKRVKLNIITKVKQSFMITLY